MCKAASFVMTKDRIYWSKTSDSHEDIISEYKLNADGLGGPNIARVEVAPPKGNLSLPLKQWVYKLDQTDVPKWYEAKTAERECRAELKAWKKQKLTGWKVKEAFNPVNPLLLKLRCIENEKLKLHVAEWASVRDSVGASVWDSVGDSVRASVGASVWASVGDSVRASVWASVGDSVWASVWASVGAYCGGLFPNIKTWKYAEKLGPDPWRPLLTLWYAGYVPSSDGKTWRLHAGKDAKVVAQWTKDEIETVRDARRGMKKPDNWYFFEWNCELHEASTSNMLPPSKRHYCKRKDRKGNERPRYDQLRCHWNVCPKLKQQGPITPHGGAR